MATPSKAQFLADVHTLLKKRYKPTPSALKLSVFEALIYGICHEDATRAQAEKALATFKSGYFDWNEVRVSSIAEIQNTLAKAGIPDAEDRATKLRRFLRQLFELQYGFNLDSLTKKPLKDSIKSLQELEAAGSDYVLATVIRLALGGHAIGIDRPTRRALERLGVVEPGVDNVTLRATLERAVPKNRGTEFVDLIEELAHDVCVEGEPDCPRCELRKICPSSRTRKPEPGTKPPPAPKVTPTAKVAPTPKATPISKPTPGTKPSPPAKVNSSPKAATPPPPPKVSPVKAVSKAPPPPATKGGKDKPGRTKP
jgi:endonuclease III